MRLDTDTQRFVVYLLYSIVKERMPKSIHEKLSL